MKPVSFSTYKMLRKLSHNDFNRWVISVYNSGLQDGINITDEEVVAELNEDRLLQILLSIKGIGQKRAEEIVEKILEEGTYGDQVRRNNEAGE